MQLAHLLREASFASVVESRATAQAAHDQGEKTGHKWVTPATLDLVRSSFAALSFTAFVWRGEAREADFALFCAWFFDVVCTSRLVQWAVMLCRTQLGFTILAQVPSEFYQWVAAREARSNFDGGLEVESIVVSTFAVLAGVACRRNFRDRPGAGGGCDRAGTQCNSHREKEQSTSVKHHH
jgi:hypothetical protein